MHVIQGGKTSARARRKEDQNASTVSGYLVLAVGVGCILLLLFHEQIFDALNTLSDHIAGVPFH
jgi:hypothetical protein